MTRTYTPAARRVIDFELQVGESPVWDARTGRLWFVDIDADLLCCLDAESGQCAKFSMPAPIGSLALTEGTEILVALRTGVFLFQPQTRQMSLVCNPEPGAPNNRLNDGKVGPDGAFWVGSMHLTRPYQPTGALYRVDVRGEATKVLDGVAVSNGLAWSPDGRTLYHTDSAVGTVCAYDLDRDPSLRDGRDLITLSRAEGIPDGAAVDREGFYWSAGVSAGCLNRISPQGELVERYLLPVAFPTMPCFGGQDGKTLFVTSMARLGDARDEGTVIAFDVEVPGAPIARFPSSRIPST